MLTYIKLDDFSDIFLGESFHPLNQLDRKNPEKYKYLPGSNIPVW